MAPSQTFTFLAGSRLFAGVPGADIESLSDEALIEDLGARAYVFMEGDPARTLCFVVSGRVKIVKHSPSGREIALELLGPGEVFGGVAVLEGKAYPASAQTLEPTRVCRVARDGMLRLTERHPQVVRQLALLIGERLRDANESRRALANDTVASRIASTLVRLGEREGVREQEVVRLPYRLTRQNLADLTGTTVETTIRILSRWCRSKLIEDRAGQIVLIDLEALSAIAGGEPEDGGADEA